MTFDVLPRLYVLPPSHYCERARWALDHAGIPYVEEKWAVGLHAMKARRIAAGTTLPILRTADRVVQGSDMILDWTGVSGEASTIEQRLQNRIAVLVRRFIYAGTLTDRPAEVRRLLLDGVPAWEGRLASLMWPALRRLMIAGMNARPALLDELEQELSSELDWFDQQVAGGRYLSGDRFGRADITAASLLSPLARPIACPLYRDFVLPDRLEATLDRWSARPGLQWVAHIYETHRRRPERAAIAS